MSDFNMKMAFNIMDYHEEIKDGQYFIDLLKKLIGIDNHSRNICLLHTSYIYVFLLNSIMLLSLFNCNNEL